ncbi:SSS family transporter [Roseimicrobium gellanilyticum]|uniref:SSS family transporter n=1 Tax=Roseimicrobium gellanilyticum TaxID=748857 RepID=A0A366HV62_9BACT|nr:sodium:solute symporter [Roseimicrobium gellanilyticum]RBP47579.1 SSS family transporter [Roseimicrobium gellanilyticum]
MAYAADILVLLLYFAVILGIGLAQSRKNKSVEGFALGDREMAWWAVLASILAAEISAATFLGAPESGYSRQNWSYAQFAIGTILARIIVSFLFIPLFYRHNVISLYEYLETRFGVVTRKFASITFMVTRVLAMGTRLYVSAIIMVLAYTMWTGEVATADTKFWLYAGAVVVVTLLTALYTSVGGIRAVIWTDFIQVGVLIASLGFTIPYLIGKIPGGWDSIGAVIKSPAFFDFAKPESPGVWAWIRNVLVTEYTLWGAIIGSTFVTMSTHGIDQDTVQRMLTAKNRRQSAFATILSGLIDLPVVSAFIFIGVLLFAYYQAFPNPNLPAETREIFPYFIMHEMPPGMRGLVTAGILATAMGSLSTALNALATSLSRDFLLPMLPADAPESRRISVMRWSTVFFAVLIIGVGIWTAWVMAHNPKLEILPLVLGILGFTFGSLLGIFLLAIFTKTRGNDMGNVIAMWCGIVVVLFMSNVLGVQEAFGFTQTNAKGETVPLLPMSFPWRITLGTFVTIAVAILFRTPEHKQRQAAEAPVSMV